MGYAYEKCIGDSPRWKLGLYKALSVQDADDVVVPFRDVARAFPAPDPHPESFDIPRVNEAGLRAWAMDKNWKVDFAAECGEPGFPAVRFTRRHR